MGVSRYFWIFSIVLYVLAFIIILVRVYILKPEQMSKDDAIKRGYGYYESKESLGITAQNNEIFRQRCIVHPVTGRGCYNEEGELSTDDIITTKPARKQKFNTRSVLFSGFDNVSEGLSFSGCNKIINKFTGIDYSSYFLGDRVENKNYFELKSCIKNDENYLFYKQDIEVCENDSGSGAKNCKKICGNNKKIIRFDTGVTLENFKDYYPKSETGSGTQLTECFDINNINQLDFLNKNLSPSINFVAPNKCYKHSNLRDVENNIWPSFENDSNINSIFINPNKINKESIYITLDNDFYNNITDNTNNNPLVKSNYVLDIDFNSYVKVIIENEQALLDRFISEPEYPLKSSKLEEDICYVKITVPSQEYFNNLSTKGVYLKYGTYDIIIFNSQIEKGNYIELSENQYYIPVKTKSIFQKKEKKSYFYDEVNDFSYIIEEGDINLENYYVYIPPKSSPVSSLFKIEGTPSQQAVKISDFKFKTQIIPQETYKKEIDFFLTKFRLGDDPKNINIKIIKPKSDGGFEDELGPIYLDLSQPLYTNNFYYSNNETFLNSNYSNETVTVKRILPDDTEESYTVFGTVDEVGTGFWEGVSILKQENQGDLISIQFNEFIQDNFYIKEISEPKFSYSSGKDYNLESGYATLKVHQQSFKLTNNTDAYFLQSGEVFQEGFGYQNENEYYILENPNIKIYQNEINDVSSSPPQVKLIRSSNPRLSLNFDRNSYKDVKINDYFDLVRNQVPNDRSKDLLFVIFPEMNLTLTADLTVFKSPYLINNDGSYNFICYNSNGTEKPYGTVVEFGVGETLYTNVFCDRPNIDENKPYKCGFKGIKLGSDERISSCVQERDTQSILFSGQKENNLIEATPIESNKRCVPLESNNYRTINNLFEDGIISQEFECSEQSNGLELSLLSSEKSRNTRCFNDFFTREEESNSRKYKKDEEVFLNKDQINYYVSLTNSNNNNLFDIDFWNRIFRFDNFVFVTAAEKLFLNYGFKFSLLPPEFQNIDVYKDKKISTEYGFTSVFNATTQGTTVTSPLASGLEFYHSHNIYNSINSINFNTLIENSLYRSNNFEGNWMNLDMDRINVNVNFAIKQIIDNKFFVGRLYDQNLKVNGERYLWSTIGLNDFIIPDFNIFNNFFLTFFIDYYQNNLDIGNKLLLKGVTLEKNSIYNDKNKNTDITIETTGNINIGDFLVILPEKNSFISWISNNKNRVVYLFCPQFEIVKVISKTENSINLSRNYMKANNLFVVPVNYQLFKLGNGGDIIRNSFEIINIDIDTSNNKSYLEWKFSIDGLNLSEFPETEINISITKIQSLTSANIYNGIKGKGYKINQEYSIISIPTGGDTADPRSAVIYVTDRDRSNYSIKSFEVRVKGSNYLIDMIYPIGYGGAFLKVEQIEGNGRIKTAKLTSGGSGYKNNIYPVRPYQGGGAKLIPTKIGENEELEEFKIIAGGEHYEKYGLYIVNKEGNVSDKAIISVTETNDISLKNLTPALSIRYMENLIQNPSTSLGIKNQTLYYKGEDSKNVNLLSYVTAIKQEGEIFYLNEYREETNFLSPTRKLNFYKGDIISYYQNVNFNEDGVYTSKNYKKFITLIIEDTNFLYTVKEIENVFTSGYIIYDYKCKIFQTSDDDIGRIPTLSMTNKYKIPGKNPVYRPVYIEGLAEREFKIPYLYQPVNNTGLTPEPIYPYSLVYLKNGENYLFSYLVSYGDSVVTPDTYIMEPISSSKFVIDYYKLTKKPSSDQNKFWGNYLRFGGLDIIQLEGTTVRKINNSNEILNLRNFTLVGKPYGDSYLLTKSEGDGTTMVNWGSYGKLTSFEIESQNTNTFSEGLYISPHGLQFVLKSDLFNVFYNFDSCNLNPFIKTFSNEIYFQDVVVAYKDDRIRQYFKNLNDNQKFDENKWEIVPYTLYPEQNFSRFNNGFYYYKDEIVKFENDLYKANDNIFPSENFQRDKWDIINLTQTLTAPDSNNEFYVVTENITTEEAVKETSVLDNKNLPLQIKNTSNKEFCPIGCNILNPETDVSKSFLNISIYSELVDEAFNNMSLIKLNGSYLSLSNAPVTIGYDFEEGLDFLSDTDIYRNELVSQFIYLLELNNEKYGKFECNKEYNSSSIKKFVISNSILFQFVTVDIDSQDYIKFEKIRDNIYKTNFEIPKVSKLNFITYDEENGYNYENDSSIDYNNTTYITSFNSNQLSIGQTIEFTSTDVGTDLKLKVTIKSYSYKLNSSNVKNLGTQFNFGDLWFLKNVLTEEILSYGYLYPSSGNIEFIDFKTLDLDPDFNTNDLSLYVFTNSEIKTFQIKDNIKININYDFIVEHVNGNNLAENPGNFIDIESTITKNVYFENGDVTKPLQPKEIYIEDRNEDLLYQVNNTDEIKVKIITNFGASVLGRTKYSYDKNVKNIDNSNTTPILFEVFKNNVFLKEELKNTTTLSLGDSVEELKNTSDVFILKFEKNTDKVYKYKLFGNPLRKPLTKLITNSLESNFYENYDNSELSVINTLSTNVFIGRKLIDFEILDSTIEFKNLVSYKSVYDYKTKLVPGQTNMQVEFNELRENIKNFYIDPTNNCSLFFEKNRLNLVPDSGILNLEFKVNSNRFETLKELTTIEILPNKKPVVYMRNNLSYSFYQNDNTNNGNQIEFVYNGEVLTKNINKIGNQKIRLDYLLNDISVSYNDYMNNNKFEKADNRFVKLFYETPFDSPEISMIKLGFKSKNIKNIQNIQFVNGL